MTISKISLALVLAIVSLALISCGDEDAAKNNMLTPEQTKSLVIKATDNLKKSKGYRFRKEIKGQVEGEDEGGIIAEGVYKDDTLFYVTFTAEHERTTTFYRGGAKLVGKRNGDDNFRLIGEVYFNEVYKKLFNLLDVFSRDLLEPLKYNISTATCTGLDTDSVSDKPPYIIEATLDKTGSEKILTQWINYQEKFTPFQGLLFSSIGPIPPSYKKLTRGQGNLDFSYPLKIELHINPENVTINQINYTTSLTAGISDGEETVFKTTIQLSEHNQIALEFPDKVTEIFANYEEVTKKSKLSAHEAAAMAGLKILISQNAIWRQQDVDGNGIKDYWTYDISCFNRVYRADGRTKIGFIDITFARADATLAPTFATADVFGGTPAIEDWLSGNTACSPAPKFGYWFRPMLTDETGQTYNQNEVNGVPATNNHKFAFVAYPDKYGETGVNTFIVNEGRTVYQTDCGSDEAKIVLQWPAQAPGGSPTAVTGPGGKRWQPAK